MKKLQKDKVQSEGRKDYVISVVINVIALYVFQRIPSWNIDFLTESYSQVQATLITAVIIGIVGNIILVILPTSLMHYLFHSIFSFVSAYALYRLYTVFPFNFASTGAGFLNTVVKIFLIISLVVTVIGLISNLFKLRIVFRRNKG